MGYRTQQHRAQRIKRKFRQYIAYLAMASVSISLTPLGVWVADEIKILAYLSGFLFWFGLLGTITTSTQITRERRHSAAFCETHPDSKRLGLIHFFQNKPALVFDVLLFVSCIGLIVARIWMGTTVWPFLFLSILIFSFGMHCMLNGSNYTYIQHQ